ncbi:SPOR domain-containing protein [Vibrio rumoiensis]|uniref:SPOR domain-containing protein n=1 Tax=Vibrio rumoiensis TaxID=76258 RepID=UPI000B5C6105|nr:SPOR domain-containing protein [Vibrio rumoiensis]
MKKIAIISLSVLFLAACSSANYDNEVSTETYQETYKTDEVPQPITESNAPLEQDLQSDSQASQPSMIEPATPETQSGKKVVKLSPPTEADKKAESSESTVKVFYPEQNNVNQPGTNNYVVQVAALQSEKFLNETAKDLPENQPKWENVKTVNGKQWHSLLFGNFKTAEEAKDAIMRLPAKYQNMGPFVKSVKSITNSQYPTLKKLP